MGAFAEHLQHAISLNRGRARRYARATGGSSLALSALLIAAEGATLPVAKAFDHQAQGYNGQGIGIVQEDFVSMEAVPPWDQAPVYTGRMDRERLRAVGRRLRTFREELKPALKALDFATVEALSAELHGELEVIEQSEQAHLAMCLHLVESIGYAAQNAQRYSAQSDGATDALARDLIRTQLAGIAMATQVDRHAQALHARGVGIVVNDVPKIPFPAR